MRDLGILESLIDPELDGFGGTALDISTVFEALGRGLVVEPFLEVGILAAKVLSRGNDAQKSLGKRAFVNEPDALSAGYNGAEVFPKAAAYASGKYFNHRKKSIYAGSNEIQKNIISKLMLNL